MDPNYQQIAISRIRDHKYQTRSINEDEEFHQLVESIRTQGLLQPICVRPDGEFFIIMAGHRRFAALKFIGMAFVSCSVLDVDLSDPWAVAFHENIYRKDMTPIEEAFFVKESMEKGDMNADELSVKIRKSVTWIRERVQICDWPDDVAGAVHAGKVSVAAAKNLAQILDDKSRALLIEYAVENGANARTTAAWLQGYKANKSLDHPEDIEPLPGQPINSQPAPHAPCLICANMFKMIEMQYLPICPNCHETVITVVQEQMRGS